MVVVLGKLAFDVYLSVLAERGAIKSRSAFTFGHNVAHPLDPVLISSYHPSQQNTSTGRLTDRMLLDVFERATSVLSPGTGSKDPAGTKTRRMSRLV